MNMKTIRFFSVLLLSAAVFASCSKDDQKPGGGGTEPGTTPIQFYQNGQTPGRAMPYTGAALAEAETFFLQAFQKSGSSGTYTADYINKTVTIDATSGSGTTLTEKFYWPANTSNSLRFIAYHPATLPSGTAAFAAGDGSMTISGYEVGADWKTGAGQYDLMYAAAGDVTNNTPVKLHFQHALARVTVQFKLKNTAAMSGSDAVKVTEISLSGLYAGGAFQASGASTAIAQAGTWTPGAANQTIKGAITLEDATAFGKNDTDTWYNPIADQKTIAPNGGQVESFFVVPMANDAFGDAALSVKVALNGADDVITPSSVTLSGLKDGDSSLEFKAGNHYNFQFNIDLDAKEITFSQVTVAEWVYNEIPAN